MFCSGTERTGGSCETADIVVGREACWCWLRAIGNRAIGGGTIKVTIRGGRRHRESGCEELIFAEEKLANAVVFKVLYSCAVSLVRRWSRERVVIARVRKKELS